MPGLLDVSADQERLTISHSPSSGSGHDYVGGLKTFTGRPAQAMLAGVRLGLLHLA